MKVCLVTPWENAWVPLFKKEIESRGYEFVLSKFPVKADIIIHGWADSQPIEGCRNVMFLRRYELFGPFMKVDWSKIDHLICVNSWIQDKVKEVFSDNKISVPVSLIYNAFDVEKWTFKDRAPGKKIGMACHVHPKKNLPLALQILARLPEDYELHIAGAIQDVCTAEYLNNLAYSMKRKIYLYGHINALDHWWEYMGCCLSSSLSEGNPNNVIEAMAKGIKPIVHHWPGAEDQFPEYTFNTVDEAVQMIESDTYESGKYRRLVEKQFSLNNIRSAVDIACCIPVRLQ